MSVCTTCLKHGLPADGRHDCPGLGDIQLSRQFGRGIVVDTAPARARLPLKVLADHAWGAAIRGPDQINIAYQVLYQVVGYDPTSAALVLELVEDWRPNSSATANGICTATLKSYEGRVFRCIRPAGHYDEDAAPEPLVEDDPGGWHQSSPDREGDRMTWSDRASSATPHTEAAVSGYPTPEMRKKTQDVKPGTPPSGPAGASSANGKRILIDPPDGSTILAARHLDATEGPVQVGSTVTAATRSAITAVLDYVARAHNSPAALEVRCAEEHVGVRAAEQDGALPWSELGTSGLLWLINRTVFHPRGLALTVHADGDMRAYGWSLARTPGGEPWQFDEDTDASGRERAEATLAAALGPTKERA